MEKLKKAGVILLVSILSLSLIADLVYLLIYLFAPNKSTVTTVYVDTLKNVEKDDLKYILNVRYFKNSNNTGEECFEVQLNYFMDEDVSVDSANDSKVYSKGIQMVNPYFDYFEDQEGGIFGVQKHIYKPIIFPYYIYNMYQGDSYVKDSFSSSETTLEKAVDKTNEIFRKDFFRISIDDDIFKVTFKNGLEDEPYKKNGDGVLNLQTHEYYHQNSAGHFLIQLYKSVKTLPAGENQVKVFEFLDTFNYQKYDPETKQYTDILNEKSEDYALITQYLVNYYAINIDVYEDGITKASQSFFKCVNGQFNFNTSGDLVVDDYFVGYDLVKLNENHVNFKFDYTINSYYIELKEEVKQYYEQYEDLKIEILININNLLTSTGLGNFVVKEDSLNIGNLDLLQVTKYWTNEEGQVIDSEVVYVE